eukprot:m.197646 g.197646  ORF g.197646 m.197646 type:complete len:502 (-) comp16826_c0_seq11:2423-3928(-)
MAQSGSLVVEILHLKGVRFSQHCTNVAIALKTHTAYGPHRAHAVVSKQLGEKMYVSLTIGIEGADQLKISVGDVHTFGRESVAASATIALAPLALTTGVTRTLSLPLSPQGEVKLVLRAIGSRPIFGVDLKVLCHQEGTLVPRLVTKCTRAIEKHGLLLEGIYRVPGAQPVIDALKNELQETQGPFEFTEEHVQNVNNIASLLKQFLSALPEPLFGSQAETMLKLFDEEPRPENLKRQMYDLIMAIQAPYRTTALTLLHHMLKVAEHQDVNHMTIANLAMCFGPTFIISTRASAASQASHHTVEEMRDIAHQTEKCNSVVAYLLENADVIHACRKQDPQYLDASCPPSPCTPSDRSIAAIADPCLSARPLEIFQAYEPVDFTAFRLVCQQLGVYVSRAEQDVFMQATNGQATMIWTQFKRWWEDYDRSSVDSNKLAALRNAARFFKHHANSDGVIPEENLTDFFAALHERQPSVSLDKLPPLTTQLSYSTYITILIKNEVL